MPLPVQSSIHNQWEALHSEAHTRLRYPHQEVVRWAFRILAAGSRATPAKILDHGCGSGRHTIFFAAEGFDVHACDFSQNAIAVVKEFAERSGVTADLRCCQADNLSAYADAMFDAVLSFGVLYYMSLAQAEQAVQEIHRILKPGGQLLCALRTDNDSRTHYAEQTAPYTWRLETLGEGTPSQSEAGMEMLFFPGEALPKLFEKFSKLSIVRMSMAQAQWVDDDWLIYATK